MASFARPFLTEESFDSRLQLGQRIGDEVLQPSIRPLADETGVHNALEICIGQPIRKLHDHGLTLQAGP